MTDGTGRRQGGDFLPLKRRDEKMGGPVDWMIHRCREPN